ncbi:maleylpyruvate isomerase N-terminal domain-containing protein [Glycomyces buryatensis]|uniref:maleylpyruvate isomerase N-terminal domain-containing protein n=1 Tax=Glycomyces buryatensis TaxID=2570927 RepID=UPI0014562DEA|nr:maleylpyruvate isomerase N-terminal domain-containing protein [Glycomyces buryatensis]
MTNLRQQYLDAAGTATGLLAADEVAAAWTADSALEGFTVAGLAGHLAAQIWGAAAALEGDYTGKDTITLMEHFGRAKWIKTDLDNEANTKVRDGGRRLAEPGPEALLEGTRERLARFETALPALTGQEQAGTDYWAYAMSLDEYLITRIMELVVHTDDLAHSVGIATPSFDSEPFDTAIRMLARLSVKRHGQAALVRALARAERAPADITGL